MEGIDGPYAQGFFLYDEFRPRHLHDLICARQAHFIAKALSEPERLGETYPLLGSVEGELRAVHVHVIEVELRETAFLCKRDAGFAQGKIEMDAGIIDLILGVLPDRTGGNDTLGLQGPHSIDGSREISSMTDSIHPAGCKQGHAGYNSHNQHSFHSSFV